MTIGNGDTLHIAFTRVGDVVCILAKDGAGNVVCREVHTVAIPDPDWRALYLAHLVAMRRKPRHLVFYSDLEVVATVEARRNTPVRKGDEQGELHWMYLQTLLQALGAFWPGNSSPLWRVKSRLSAARQQSTWQMHRVDTERLKETRGLIHANNHHQ